MTEEAFPKCEALSVVDRVLQFDSNEVYDRNIELESRRIRSVRKRTNEIIVPVDEWELR